jgi:hypothetical protein
VWKKENMFGEICNGEMTMNEYGDIVTKCWDGLPNHYQHLQLDEFIVMPNHLHGIVVLTNVGAQFIAPVRNAITENQGTSNQGAINRAPTKNNGMNTVGTRRWGQACWGVGVRLEFVNMGSRLESCRSGRENDFAIFSSPVHLWSFQYPSGSLRKAPARLFLLREPE